MTENEQNACLRAKDIIDVMGGVTEVVRITGRSASRVYSWTYPKERHGTGGLIPPECQQLLIAYSRAHKLGLTPAHFFPQEPDVNSGDAA